MASMTICGKTITVNDEGFLTNPADWDRDLAVELAKEEGIAQLSDAHWKVIDFCRKEGVTTGKAPTLRQITTGTGLTTKELFGLYPKGPAKKVARISGLGKPEGCV